MMLSLAEAYPAVGFPNVSVELVPALKAKERIVENSESVNDESNEQ